MPATLTKVVYKPDTQSTEEYTVIVNPEEVRRASYICGSYTYHSFNSTRSGSMVTRKLEEVERSFMILIPHIPQRTIPLAQVVDCAFYGFLSDLPVLT